MNAEVNELGKNLNILIRTETTFDWQTFATWYSFFKNLPEAEICIVCNRNTNAPFQYFQWIKRLKIRHLFQNQFSEDEFLNKIQNLKIAADQGFIKKKTLVVEKSTMAIDTLNEHLLDLINTNEEIVVNKNICYFPKTNKDYLNKLLDNYFLETTNNEETTYFCYDVKEIDEPVTFVSFEKGCGTWINKLKGCPFSGAERFISIGINVNESRVIELWKKMTCLFNVAM